jgi:hypothetical protein
MTLEAARLHSLGDERLFEGVTRSSSTRRSTASS